MQKWGQRASLAVAALAMGAAGFSGTALAGGHVNGDGGSGGAGGKANANCAIPIGVSAGIIGQGGDNKQCDATAGAGGAGGAGVDY